MSENSKRHVTLFLCGDVMTGRGIDQVLPHPSDPAIPEPYARSALDYVSLAERVNGPIDRPVDFRYVWGDLPAELADRAPDVRIIDLETSVTTSACAAKKTVTYRMHPANVPVLTAAGIDCCALANNHVLDWGPGGLLETLATLRDVGIATAGAGRDHGEACRPAVLDIPSHGGRVLVWSVGSAGSGIPHAWGATGRGPGVCLQEELTPAAAEQLADRIRGVRRAGDVVVVSIHWGGNWGYRIPDEQREFGRRLVDGGYVDVVHGHSSHHRQGIECRDGRPIMYGCGDLLNDYEGISGHEEMRPDLTSAYVLTLDAGSGRLERLVIVPFRIVRFSLRRASAADAQWLWRVMVREGRPLGTGAALSGDGSIELRW